MKEFFDICVIGGGIPGIYTTYKLKKFDVCLINSGKSLGGVANGFQWDNYKIDFGCRFLDGDSKLFDFYKKVGGAKQLSNNYGAYNSGVLKTDIANPEFNKSHLKDLVLEELRNLKVNKSKKFDNLHQFLIENYGKLVGNYLSEIQKKITGLSSDKISANSFLNIPLLQRIRIFNDEISNELKKINEHLESIICSSLESRGEEKKQLSMYSKSVNLSSFGKNSELYFQKNKVDFKNNFQIKEIKIKKHSFEIISELGEIIECKKIISTLGLSQVSNLFNIQNKQPVIHTSFNFLALEVNTKNLTDIHYVQDYDLDHISYRTSNMGMYSNQILDGKTFLLVEIPYGKDVPKFGLPQIVNEIKKQGIIKDSINIDNFKTFNFQNIIPFNQDVPSLDIHENFYELDYLIFDTKNRLYYLDGIVDSII